MDVPKSHDRGVQVDMAHDDFIYGNTLAADHIVSRHLIADSDFAGHCMPRSGVCCSHKAIQVRPSMIDLREADRTPEIPPKPKVNIKRRKAVKKRQPSTGSDAPSPPAEPDRPAGHHRRKPKVPPKPPPPSAPMFSDTDMDIVSGSDREGALVKASSMASMPGLSEMIFMPESEQVTHVPSQATDSSDSDWETRSAISL